MPLRSDLLTAIPGPNVAGADLRYDPIYDKIKEARHEDDDAPLGDWQRPRKTADFALVTKLAGDALAARSKDLQIAAWLTEAQLKREGFAGLRSGLELMRALLAQYWESLYPPLEDGDPELRAAPLSWVGLSLSSGVRSVPLNRSGHDFFKYKESRSVGYEAELADDAKRTQARNQALSDGKLSPEDFDKAFETTPKSWYKDLMAELDGCVAALAALDQVSREKFGEATPDFRRLEESLTDVQRVVRQLLNKKLEIEPDPPEATPPAPNPTTNGSGSGEAAMTTDSAPARVALGAEAADREDATARAIAAARYLRRTEPHNPASYLLLRGFRWGEVRAHGGTPDPRLLDAPSTQIRTQLKGLLLEAKWPQLLEAGEGVMATAAGRGWLDLQRYVLSACDGLGSQFEAVGRAIRGELRALLDDVPALLGMTLMDDMPTANPETRRWLQEQGLTNGRSSVAATEVEEYAAAPAPAAAQRAYDHVLDRALAEVTAGRPQRGIELLMSELAKEKTPRARFLRRTQIVRIMVDSGLESVAVPILQELLTLVENHKLAEWEAGELVAEPLTLLYRCIEKLPDLGGDHSQATLYPRICSLDPLQALSLKQP
ncbi:MAG TPA: type VI secretion system protein TssA [Gemmatimonadales bacterium]